MKIAQTPPPAPEPRARQANDSLKALLEQERRRNEQLENKGSTHAVDDVDIAETW